MLFNLFLVIDEIKEYIHDNNITDDSISYWTGKEVQFPWIYAAFLRTIAVQASEIPAERLFSSAGLTATKKRPTLSDYKLEIITFLNNN